VLVVEDEADVARLAVRALEEKGYDVLLARDGVAAQTLAREVEAPIHLLLTDVVMPGASGKEVAESLLADRPEIRVLFMSGYTGNVIVRHGVLDGGGHFIQKPFTPEVLLRRVRSVLDTSTRPPSI